MSYQLDFRPPPNITPKRIDFIRIASYTVPGWRQSLLILLCIATSALLGLIPPLLVRDIIDHAFPEKNSSLLIWSVIGMISVAVINGLIGVWRNYLVTIVGQSVMFDLRSRMYDRLIHQSLKFFTTARSGDLLSRLQNDVAGVQGVVTGTMVSVVSNSFVVIGTLVVLLNMDWMLALVAAGVLPLFILPARKVGRAAGQLSKETQERLSELTSTVQETLSVSGFLLARVFGAQAQEQKRFVRKAGAVRDLQIKQSMTGRWFLMWLTMFASIGPALIYLVGGVEVIANRITMGTVVAFVSYLGLLYMPVSALVNVHVDIMKAVALFRRIFEYLDLPIEIGDSAHPIHLSDPKGELRFDNVSITYGTNKSALNNVSFVAYPGQMIAIVGPSGAGKTTLSYLATRLYDPTAGRVCFDGVDLRELPMKDLAMWFATVTQETTLFNATLAENLRYAKPDASDEELHRVCRLAQIHDVILALPSGYATKVGERGYKLSGGEKQRLAMARVLLRDPRVLIFDEATSSLDSSSEALVQSALEPLLQGRTSIVIAHRLSTVLRADMILVLNQGHIVERGTHAELLVKDGLYGQLYNQQFKVDAKKLDPDAQIKM